MLVAGQGGQGKTRLARQFAGQPRQAGWAAGFLAARAAAHPAGDGRSQLDSAVELARRVGSATRPALLVADYAETRPEEITSRISLTSLTEAGQARHLRRCRDRPARHLTALADPPLEQPPPQPWSALAEQLQDQINHRPLLSRPVTTEGQLFTRRRHVHPAPAPPVTRVVRLKLAM